MGMVHCGRGGAWALLGRVCKGVTWAFGMLCSLLRACLCGKVIQSFRVSTSLYCKTRYEKPIRITSMHFPRAA